MQLIVVVVVETVFVLLLLIQLVVCPNQFTYKCHQNSLGKVGQMMDYLTSKDWKYFPSINSLTCTSPIRSQGAAEAHDVSGFTMSHLPPNQHRNASTHRETQPMSEHRNQKQEDRGSRPS